MQRRAVAIVVATALIGLLFAVVSTSGGVGLWRAPQWEPAPAVSEPAQVEERSDTSEEPERPESSDSSFRLPEWVTGMLNVLALAALFVALAMVLRSGWTRRPALRWGPRAEGAVDVEALPDVAGAVVDDADSQRAELLTGAPRNAIVRCWLRLEQDVAAVGLRRRPADTSAEFTERVLASYSIDARAIRDLAALYREARFSDHVLDEEARRAALDALDRLHRALAAERGGRSADPSGAVGHR